MDLKQWLGCSDTDQIQVKTLMYIQEPAVVVVLVVEVVVEIGDGVAAAVVVDEHREIEKNYKYSGLYSYWQAEAHLDTVRLEELLPQNNLDKPQKEQQNRLVVHAAVLEVVGIENSMGMLQDAFVVGSDDVAVEGKIENELFVMAHEV